MATKCPNCGSTNTARVRQDSGLNMRCNECRRAFTAKPKESIDAAAWRKLDAAAQNRALCEGVYGAQELIETVLVPGSSIKAAIVEAVTGPDGSLGWINVSRVDAVTDDVQGKPEVVEGHSDGANLMALVRAGRAIAFSTRGRGSAHLPTAEEKAKYRLEDGVDDDVVIIDSDYDLNAIDNIDSPSCPTAYKPGTSRSTPESIRSIFGENRLNTQRKLTAADIRRRYNL